MNIVLIMRRLGGALCLWSGLLGGAQAQEAPGVDLDLGLRAEVLRDVRGGYARGTSPIGLIDLKIGADLFQSSGGAETRAFINVLHHVGEAFNSRSTGSLTGVSNIEVLSNTTRLYRLWVEHQTPIDGRQHAFLVGLLPLEDEFFTMEAAANLIHPTAGPQGDLALTRGPAIYPNASFGARWKVQDQQLGWYGMAAVLDGIAGGVNRPKATHPLRFVQRHGTHLIAETGYAPLASRKAQGDAIEEFHKTAVGLWRYTPRDNDLLEIQPDGQPARSLSWGWYALIERTLYKAPQPLPLRLAGFFRLSGSDGDTAPIDRSLNVGLRATGLMADRPEDVLSLMVAKHRMASKWQQAERINGRGPAGREDMIEINYQAVLPRQLKVLPLAQWWSFPGGRLAVRHATVLGVRLSADF